MTTEKEHTNITELIVDGVHIDLKKAGNAGVSDCEDMESCYDSRTWTALIDKIYSDTELVSILRDGIDTNLKAADFGRKYDSSNDDYGVTGAIIARMNGDPIPVMSVAGSGNKGLTSLIASYKYATATGADKQTVEKATLLAAFVTSLVTRKFGAVSSVCGVVYAAGSGFLAAKMYIDGKLDHFEGAHRNYISSVGGVFCDGAKGSCALKGSASVIMAERAGRLSSVGFEVDGMDGYLGKDFLGTLDNLVKYNEKFAQFDESTIGILKDKS